MARHGAGVAETGLVLKTLAAPDNEIDAVRPLHVAFWLFCTSMAVHSMLRANHAAHSGEPSLTDPGQTFWMARDRGSLLD